MDEITGAPLLAPSLRSSLQYAGWGLVLAAWGFAESFANTFALALFVIWVIVGWMTKRRETRFVNPAVLPIPPAAFVLETPAGTALRMLAAHLVFIALVVAGLFAPVSGAIGGGMTLGFALRLLYASNRLARNQKRGRWQLLYEVPPRRFFVGRQPHWTYFCSATPSSATRSSPTV